MIFDLQQKQQGCSMNDQYRRVTCLVYNICQHFPFWRHHTYMEAIATAQTYPGWPVQMRQESKNTYRSFIQSYIDVDVQSNCAIRLNINPLSHKHEWNRTLLSIRKMFCEILLSISTFFCSHFRDSQQDIFFSFAPSVTVASNLLQALYCIKTKFCCR